MSSSSPRKILIDCDTGTDDAIALLMACQDPSFDLVAVTCVAGNTTLDKVVLNTLECLNIFDLHTKIPVYAGARTALLGKMPTPCDFHGPHGLGGITADPDLGAHVNPKFAPQAIVDLVSDTQNLTIIAIGPLTNIAIALTIDPCIFRKIDNFVWLGGTNEMRGNLNPTAEFNCGGDPEAAKAVFHSRAKLMSDAGECCDFVVLPLDPIQPTTHTMTWQFFDGVIAANADNKVAQFVSKLFATVDRNVYKYFELYDAYALHALNERIATKKSAYKYSVICQPALCRGKTVVWKEDHATFLEIVVDHEHDVARHVKIVEELDSEHFKTLFTQLIES